ncbi:hypothetical protein PROFUN_06139 [Planoprotostelium fungivorum]|uniref:Cell cycle checkpoint protein RAD1 n=1 Tax=Planoprotostelium fungivorum TaxID=1890364 RepID=A0A2P6NPI2_9EUKA|nr:hypothetical protein PROFUN_06139 [Planoprotostelium fungivorum]
MSDDDSQLTNNNGGSASGAGSVGNHTTQNSGKGDEEQQQFQFVCKIDNARILHNILSALAYKKDGQMATLSISANGLKFTVEESNSFQGNAFLQQELFQEYHFSSKHEQFKINFSLLLDCLNIYGSGASFVSLQIGYRGYGHPLLLLLEQGGATTHCGLSTLDSEQLNNFNFRGHNIVNKVIMEAPFLKEAFDELDWSSTNATITLSPNDFRLSTAGASGSCQVDYPHDSEVFESFECKSHQTNTYKLALLSPAIKALSIAQKTQMRLNEIGLLSFQHMIENEDKNISFVDFFVAPLEEDMNDNED